MRKTLFGVVIVFLACSALTARWATFQRSCFWLNPPYSKCREFIAKAAAEAARGTTTVCLVPSRTDTRWWHEHVWDHVRHCARPGVEIRFIKGRLVFGGAPASAPFPSVVIVFRPEHLPVAGGSLGRGATR